MAQPDFFVIGPGRSGTTAMHTYLDAHPQIFMSPVKETWHFCTDLIPRDPNNFIAAYRDDAAYFALFDGAQSGQRVGESTPGYLMSRVAAENIQAYNPRSQFVVMLRSPIDVLYSAHSKLWGSGDEDISSFEEALAAQAARKQGQRIPATLRTMPQVLQYFENIRYSEQIEHYFDRFPREQIHVIIFEDFKRDTAGVYRETLRFLGVDPNFATDLSPVNENVEIHSPRLLRFLQKPPRWLMTAGNLVRPVARPLYWRIRGLNQTQKPRPPMKPETRRRLQAEFRPEVERLSALLDRDLMYWVEND